MIEKLPFTQIHTGGEDMVDRVEIQPVAPYEMQHKINELVDAVNELQTKVNKMAQNLNFAQPEVKENVQDKFAEQRRWIGKLCRFKNNLYEPDLWDYGILTDILNVDPAIDSVFRSSDGHCYDMCEPVSPDDDIVYKGGDNE